MIMFGVFPTALLIIGISIFILKSIPLMFSPNTNYFICIFMQFLLVPFKRWIDGKLGYTSCRPLGLAKRNVTYKNSELIT